MVRGVWEKPVIDWESSHQTAERINPMPYRPPIALSGPGIAQRRESKVDVQIYSEIPFFSFFRSDWVVIRYLENINSKCKL